MKQSLTLLAISTLILNINGMDYWCQVLAGKKEKYLVTLPEERQTPLRILNQTDGLVQLKATYECKVQASYPAICCFARCWSTKYIECTKKCTDLAVYFKKGQTIDLSPVDADIFKSKLRLVALRAKLNENSEWLEVKLPSTEIIAPDVSYQSTPGVSDGSTCVLMHDGNEGITLI